MFKNKNLNKKLYAILLILLGVIAIIFQLRRLGIIVMIVVIWESALKKRRKKIN